MKKLNSIITRFYQEKKDTFIVFSLFLIFPPLPRVCVSLIFKIEFVIIVLISIFAVVSSIFKRKRIEYHVELLILFLIPVLWGVVSGLFRSNYIFEIVKDNAYFLVPLLVFLLASNNKEWFDRHFFSGLFKFATIVSLVQVFFSSYGFYLGVDRAVFRHVFLIFPTEIIPYVLVLKVIEKGSFFDKRALLFVLTLLMTRGRADLLFLGVFSGAFFLERVLKNNIFKRLYLFTANLGFAVVWFFPILYPEILNFFKASLRWRYLEWRSYFSFIAKASWFSLLTGQGFGSSLLSLKLLRIFAGNKIFMLNKFHNIFLYFVFKLGIIGFLFIAGCFLV